MTYSACAEGSGLFPLRTRLPRALFHKGPGRGGVHMALSKGSGRHSRCLERLHHRTFIGSGPGDGEEVGKSWPLHCEGVLAA